jgi:hypothetical protein
MAANTPPARWLWLDFAPAPALTRESFLTGLNNPSFFNPLGQAFVNAA